MSMSILKSHPFCACVCALILLLTGCGGSGGSGGGATEFTVTATAGAGGSITPSSATVASGNTTSFTVTANSGYAIDSVSGCGGTLSGNTYTTGPITSDCTVSATFLLLPPVTAAELSLSFNQTKLFHFTWSDVPDATFYRLLENPDGASGFTQVGTDIPAGTEVYDHMVPLYARVNAQYILSSCNDAGCIDSGTVSVSGNLAEAVGYFKASNPEPGDSYGYSVALSTDGSTLAVGAPYESSDATGVDGDEGNNNALYSGAVYVFVRNGTTWSQQAYIKASNTETWDRFGSVVALSADGNTLAVGAPYEDSDATGVHASSSSVDNNSATESGAVYIFARSGAEWTQQAYIKALNTDADDFFGSAVALSADGSTLAVGAYGEDSNGTDGQTDNTADQAGAVYVYSYNGASWGPQAYVKAQYTGFADRFGWAVALSADGNTLAIGAIGEKSSATGVGGEQDDDSLVSAGAVYVFTRSSSVWFQQAFIKAAYTDNYNFFGNAVALSADGNTLAVGVYADSSAATGINGDPDPTGNFASGAGAAYVFVRSGVTWSQQAYIKASNTDPSDRFGWALSLSADGNTLVVGAYDEDSLSIGIGGDQGNVFGGQGAVYVFNRNASTWSQQAYVKASNSNSGDTFGYALALSADSNTLAVGAWREQGGASGINGDQSVGLHIGLDVGAVYLY